MKKPKKVNKLKRPMNYMGKGFFKVEGTNIWSRRNKEGV